MVLFRDCVRDVVGCDFDGSATICVGDLHVMIIAPSWSGLPEKRFTNPFGQDLGHLDPLMA